MLKFVILRALLCSIIISFIIFFSVDLKAEEIVIVPAGASWKYLDDGSDLGTSWTDPLFDDSGWSSGPAELGYGDGDESTTVSFGASNSNKYITTYFRHTFNLSDMSGIVSLKLRLLRDDGAVVYLNGAEIHRSNLPVNSAINYLTTASSAVSQSSEGIFLESFISSSDLVSGDNTVAVEIHQKRRTDSDISFDLELIGSDNVEVIRGPYLQKGSDTTMVIKWNTNAYVKGFVKYGTSITDLNSAVSAPSQSNEHEFTIENLNSDTKYFYSIGYNNTENNQEVILAGGDSGHFFSTFPAPGTTDPARIWIIGDSGTANANAQAVKDAYLFNYSETDLWLMLGDNAYENGTDEDYQSAVFDMYPELLINTVLWPTLGNHDGHTSNSITQTGPYYKIFSLPIAGESGGFPSGTEAYYSFDYGNIHFICLNSYDIDRSKPENGGVMLSWLEDDLLNTYADWVIAFWHHPPYTKGSHDSDDEVQLIQMRENAVEVLEKHGVDLVLSGHSHSYERSFLIDNHLGSSGTLRSSMILDGGNGKLSGDGAYQKPSAGLAPHEGAVYVVAGSSGKATVLQPDAPHPVMIATLLQLGSVVLEIDGNSLNAQFLRSDGNVADNFTILKGGTSTPICGNSIGEIGEQCDGADFKGQTCMDFGCSTGDLTCTVQCTIDSSSCSSCPACGDDTCDADEDFCSCSVDCGTSPLSETSCYNNFDEDCDGLIDCDDSDCDSDPACNINCSAVGSLCTLDSECCTNKCRGKPGAKICK